MKKGVVIILLNCLACCLYGQVDTFIIQEIGQNLPLNGHLSVMEVEKEANLDLAAIRSDHRQEAFTLHDEFIKKYLPASPSGEVLLDPGKIYWWRLYIRNELDQPIRDWVLHTGRSNFTDVHFIGENGQLLASKRTGWLVPTDEKDYLYGNRQAERVSFHLEEGESMTVYGRVEVINKKEPFIKVQLAREDYFKNWHFIEKTRLEWTAIGSLLTFILFNVLLYFSTRDRVFLWHTLYLTGIFLYLLEFFNVLPDLVFMRDHRILSQVFIYLTLCLMDVACINFIRSFMNMKKSQPIWDQRLQRLAFFRMFYTAAVVAFYLATVNMKLADDLTAYYMVGQYVFLLGLLFRLFGWKDKQGRFLIIGTAFFVAAIVINAFAVVMGIGLIFSFTALGIMGEVVVFTLGLGYRMRKLIREEREAIRLKDLDEFKSRFYTNITHEFRTPLTVIMGNVEMGQKEIEGFEEAEKEGNGLKKKSNKFQFLRSNFETIQRNAQQLLRLINRLLDLSKLQSGKMPLNLTQSDIASYLRYLVESFHSFAAGKDIHLRYLSSLDHFDMDFDAEKIQDIMTNLISNAVKFSPPGSEITVKVEVLGQVNQLLISIKDEGIGIPPAAMPYIFDRFATAKDSGNPEGGSGIGLALTKELVELMKGNIQVDSNADEQQGETGSEFRIILPVTRQAEKKETVEPAAAGLQVEPIMHEAQPLEKPQSHTKPRCLVIDDNADIVSYLKNLLSDEYDVATAYDGQRGIEKALVLMPDVIISDVMMPEKDGLEVCDFLKNDHRTSHIPIILLTAKATVEDRLEGLRRGADAYLQKPFNQEELFISLRKSVELRNRLVSYFSRMPFGFSEQESATETLLEPDMVLEDTFLKNARNAVEENISDDQFGILQLCRLLTMSRAQLHRKLTALTGMSASHFINSIRLKKAKHFLLTSDMNVSEVAYEVGFKDPNYFTRLYTREFGEPPSETRK